VQGLHFLPPNSIAGDWRFPQVYIDLVDDIVQFSRLVVVLKSGHFLEATDVAVEYQ
jgi:hypothetical protein